MKHRLARALWRLGYRFEAWGYRVWNDADFNDWCEAVEANVSITGFWDEAE